MASNQQISVTLPERMIELVRRKVSSGQYADESAVIADGLTFLEDEEHYFERWLSKEAVPACREYDQDPSSALSSAELALELEKARRH